MRWTLIKQQDNQQEKHPQGYYHSSVLLNRNPKKPNSQNPYLLIYGGGNPRPNSTLTSLEIINSQTVKWNRIPLDRETARSLAHSAIPISNDFKETKIWKGDFMFMHGGQSQFCHFEVGKIYYNSQDSQFKYQSYEEHPTLNPEPRSGHTLCQIENKIYCFGGYAGGYFTYNNMWIFNLNTQQWREVPMTRPWPQSRWCHTCAVLPSGKHIAVIGGKRFPDIVYNEIWVFNIETHQFRKTQVENSDQRKHMFGMRAVSVPGSSKIYVFGGSDGEEVTNDVWVLHTNDDGSEMEWEKMTEIEGTPPSPRYGPSVSLVKMDFSKSNLIPSNNNNNIENNNIRNFQNEDIFSNMTRTRRYGIVITGGNDYNEMLDDVHILDLENDPYNTGEFQSNVKLMFDSSIKGRELYSQ